MKQPDTYTISKQDLRDIIKQELEAAIKERSLTEINPYHHGKGRSGGQFTTKEKGDIYSVPHKHKSKVKNIPTGRGKNKKGKPVAKFGMSSGSPEVQCGRMTVDGNPKKKTRRCDDYPRKYWQNEGVDSLTGLPQSDEQKRQQQTPQRRRDDLGVMPADLDRLARGIYEAVHGCPTDSNIWTEASHLRRLSGLPEGLVAPANSPLASKCRAAGFRTFEDLLKAMDAMKRASDGKLTEPPKTG